MAAYAVTYSYVPETEAMQEARPRHVEFLADLFERGHILASGRLTEADPLGALIVVDGESTAAVESLLDGDPFYTGGFVAERLVRKWNIAFGSVGAPETAGNQG